MTIEEGKALKQKFSTDYAKEGALSLVFTLIAGFAVSQATRFAFRSGVSKGGEITCDYHLGHGTIDSLN